MKLSFVFLLNLLFYYSVCYFFVVFSFCFTPSLGLSLGLTLCGYLFTGVSTDMPNFSHMALVEKFGHKETLTYVYFLKHGRPAFAFTSFMAKYQHRKYIPKARYDQLTLFIPDHSNNPGYIDSSFSYLYRLFFLLSKRNRQNNF